jgi:phosphoribosylformylglycinamidine synthase subunit PurS
VRVSKNSKHNTITKIIHVSTLFLISIKAQNYSEDKLISIQIWKLLMATFNVHVTIENKPGISDPEGDTILNDLVLKGTHKTVSKIKTAKMLKFTIKEKDRNAVKSKIQEICDELRIFNPMVSKVTIDVFDA